MAFWKDALWQLWYRILKSHPWLYEWKGWITNYAGERRQVIEKVGYDPDLENPETINEKILWKKLNVRDPLLTRTTDKIKVREYVREKLKGDAEDLIIPVLDVADTPNELSLDGQEPPFVIKANHGSDMNLFVHDRRPDGAFLASTGDASPSTWTRQEIVDQCSEWLDTPYGLFMHEWSYLEIERKVFIEPFVEGLCGSRSIDVKIDCFSGTPMYVLVKVGEEKKIRHTILDSRGNELDVRYEKFEDLERVPESVSSSLPRLRRFASRLSEDFGYCRVDFYVTSEGLRFGEITHYPSSGRRSFNHGSFDKEMGRHWQIDRMDR